MPRLGELPDREGKRRMSVGVCLDPGEDGERRLSISLVARHHLRQWHARSEASFGSTLDREHVLLAAAVPVEAGNREHAVDCVRLDQARRAERFAASEAMEPDVEIRERLVRLPFHVVVR